MAVHKAQNTPQCGQSLRSFIGKAIDHLTRNRPPDTYFLQRTHQKLGPIGPDWLFKFHSDLHPCRGDLPQPPTKYENNRKGAAPNQSNKVERPTTMHGGFGVVLIHDRI